MLWGFTAIVQACWSLHGLHPFTLESTSVFSNMAPLPNNKKHYVLPCILQFVLWTTSKNELILFIIWSLSLNISLTLISGLRERGRERETLFQMGKWVNVVSLSSILSQMIRKQNLFLKMSCQPSNLKLR